MKKFSLATRSVFNIFKAFLFAACLIFLFSGTGMAIIYDGGFELTEYNDSDPSVGNADLRNLNPPSEYWHESREDGEDGPSLLELNFSDIQGNASKKALLIASTTIEAEAYLTQEFSSPLTGIADIEWQIYVEEVLDSDSDTDRAGFMLIGDGSNATTNGPNSDDNERFVCMAFLKDGGGSSGTMDLVAQDNDDPWSTFTPVATGLNMDEWHTIRVRCYPDEDNYDIYVGDEFKTTIPARYAKDSLTHISFAQLSNGAGTFYVDNVSQVDVYSVTFTSGGNGSIIGDTNQLVIDGEDSTEVTAEPNTGYHFDDWSGDYTSTENPLTITNVTSDMNISANFAINTYTVDFTSGGNGSITGEVSQTVDYGGTSNAVTAVPATGYHFINWTWDGNESEETTLTITNVTADMNITANFEINTYTVNFSSGGNGSIEGNTSQTVTHGGSCTAVTADPDAEYHFLNWTGEGFTTSSDITLNVTNVTANMNITANFSIDTYSVIFSAGDHGNITGDTNQIVGYGGSCTEVSAEPDTGYHFGNWSGDYTGTDNPLTINDVTSNLNVTANFEANSYSVTFSAETHGGINGDTSQNVLHGENCSEVRAVPESGYHFIGWTGDYRGSDNPLTIANVTGDMNIIAIFESVTHDGNGDGIPDAQQEHVKNLITEFQQSVTLEFSESVDVTRCATIRDPSPDNRPTDYDFRYGFFNFTIEGVGIGGVTTVSIYLPEGAVPETYYKYGLTPEGLSPHWYEFMYDGTTGAEINENIITLHFVDGERGDDDLTANGTIIDDGGPGFSNADTPLEAEGEAETEPSGSSGECFIGAASSSGCLFLP